MRSSRRDARPRNAISRGRRVAGSLRRLSIEPLEVRVVLTGGVDPDSVASDAWIAVDRAQVLAQLAGKQYVANELVVALRDSAVPTSFAEVITLERARDAAVTAAVAGGRLLGNALGAVGTSLYHVTLAAGTDLAEAISAISQWSNTAWVAPNFIYTSDDLDPRELTPNDPSYSSQYHHAKMQNAAAWDISQGAGVIVAVTDDGVDWDHTDLAANIWNNSDETAGNGIDDDGNGFIDDVRGWDFSSNDNNPDHVSGDDHGTHVAGIIAAVTNNAIGVAGTAGQATIMPVRFYGSGSWTSTVIFNSYKYATDNGAKIISTSYNIDSFASDPTFASAVNYAYTRGVLHFNSAGNNNQLDPARAVYDQMLFVSSTDSGDVKSSFTNYGRKIDVAAPGSNIYATLPNNLYGTKSGTSMSTPNAAAVAALIWSAHPTWTRDQVATQLLATADNIDAINASYVGLLGTGRVNSYRALTETVAAPKIKGVTELIGATVSSLSKLTVQTVSRFDETTIENAGNWELRRDGADGVFDTADDVVIAMTRTTDYMIGSNEVVFTFSSLTTDRYRFTVKSGAGGLKDAFGTQLDGNADGTAGGDYVREFTVAGPISVASSTPTHGTTLAPPVTAIEINFDRNYQSSSIGTSDLSLSRGTVASFTLVDADTVRYNVSGLTADGPLTYSIAAGAVLGADGTSLTAFSATVTLDADVTSPISLTPLGSTRTLALSGSQASSLGGAADIDGYSLELLAGQSLTLTVSSSAAVQVRVTVAGPGGTSVSATASAAGATALLQAIPITAAGNYTITIESANGDGGTYTVQALVNAVTEIEVLGGSGNNTQATAQDLTAAWLALGSSGSRAVVSGAFTGTNGTVASEGFEAGVMPAGWTTFSTPAGGRIQVTTSQGAAAGTYAMIMDTSLSSTYTLNQAEWSLNLAGLTNVRLIFSHADYSDEEEAMPTSFTGNSNADGVAFSVDGTTWYRLWNAVNQSTTAWQQYNLDLSAASAAAGVMLGANTRIRFQQYDNNSISGGDGRGWDAISVTADAVSGPDDWYRVSLSAGESFSAALYSAASTPAFEFYDGAGNRLAVAAVSGSEFGVHRFIAPSTGDYYIRLSGTSAQGYQLLLTKGAAIDGGGNDQLVAPQFIGGIATVLASSAAGDTDDYYRLSLSAGATLHVTTATPVIGLNGAANLFDPALELYDAAGVLVASDDGSGPDNSGPDARNAAIVYTTSAAGFYRLRVRTVNESGPYLLTLTGADAVDAPLAASSTTPVAGTVVRQTLDSLTVKFNDAVNLTTVAADDLTINGAAATGFSIVAADSVKFTFTPPARGTVNVAMAAGAVFDLQDTPLEAFAMQLDYQENRAPVLTATPAPTLTSINEDEVGNAGMLVTALLATGAGGDPISDLDSADPEGIAITAVDTTQGALQYSLDNGANWLAMGAVSTTNARLLAADAQTRIRFVPNSNFNGTITAAVTFRAWDQLTGVNGGAADVTTSGGISGFSVDSATASIAVAPVNDAPAGTGQTASITGGSSVEITLAGNDNDAGVSQALTFAIVSNPTHGTITNFNASAGTLTYTPAVGYFGVDSFTFQVTDDATAGGPGLVSGSATVSINVNPDVTSQLIPVTSRRNHVFDPMRDVLYVTTSAGKVERYDAATGTLLASWTVGSGTLNGLDITADGRYLYVGDGTPTSTQGFVRKLDLFTGAVSSIAYTLDSLETGVWDLRISADNKVFFTTNFAGSGWNPLHVINIADDTLSSPFDVRQHSLIARGADRSLLFFTESNISSGPIFSYRSQSGAFSSETSTNTFLDSFESAVNRNGTLVAMESGSGLQIRNATSLSTVITNLAGLTGGVVFDPLRDRLYAVNPTTDRIEAYDTNTWVQQFSFAVGESMTGSSPFGEGEMSISDDGSRLFLSTTSGVRMFNLGYTDLPVGVGDRYTATQGTALIVDAANGVLVNDENPQGGTLQSAVVVGPRHGTLTLNGDGSFVYTATAGFAGFDSFSYSVTNGAAIGNTGLVAIQVRPVVNGAPSVADDLYYVFKNGSITTLAANGVLANDGDPEFDPITAQLVTGPQHGTLTLNADGSFVYAPSSGYLGADSFVYRAIDSFGAPTTGTVALNVVPNDSGTLVALTSRRDHVVDVARNMLYVTTSTGVVQRYDIGSGTLLTSWTVGTGTLNGMDLTADGQFLYVGDGTTSGTQGFVRKIDLTTGAVTSIAYTRASGEVGVWDLEISADGYAFFTTQFSGSGWTPLHRITLADDTQTTVRSVRQNTHIARGGDRSLLFFTESNSSGGPAFTYDTQTGTFPASTSINSFLDSVLSAVNRDGTLIAMESGSGLSILTPTLQGVTTLAGLSGGLVFDPMRDVLYAIDPTANQLVAVDTQYWRELYRRSIGEDISGSSPMSAGVMSISDDGHYLFVSTAAGIRAFDLDGAGLPTITTIADQSISEETSATVEFTVTDPDTPLSALTVTATSGNTTLLPNSNLTVIDLGGGKWGLTATPAVNQFGTVTVTVSAADRFTPATTSFTLNVANVNDSPSFTRGADQFAAVGAGLQTVANWATNISMGPNEIGQTLDFLVSNDNSALFSVQPTISPTGTLTYAPAGIVGTAVVSVRLHDDGGGNDTSPVQTFTIQVVPPPRVISTSIQQGDVAGYGDLTVVVGFDHAMLKANLDASDFALLGIDRGVNHAATSFSYDAGGTTLTVNYSNLPEDRYSFTLVSGNGRFEDAAGGDLDGEALAWPIPPNVSGDGAAGGNFVVAFSTDTPTTAFLAPLGAIALPGSLIYASSATTPYTAYITFAGDTDDVTVSLDAGQTLSAVVTPSVGLQAEVSIYNPNDVLNGTFTSAAGAKVLVQTAAVPAAGVYKMRLGGVGGTTGTMAVAITLNAALEAEAHGSPLNNDTQATAQNLDGSFIALTGTAARGAVLGSISGAADQDWYGFTLSAGESTTLLLRGTSGAVPSIRLVDAAGNTLARGIFNTPAQTFGIQDFVAQSTGTYYAAVASTGASNYALLVNSNLGFNLRGNGSIAAAQQLTSTAGAILGALDQGGGLGRLYVYDATAALIRELNPTTGAILNSFASPVGTSGSDIGLATTPTSVLVGSSSASPIYELNPNTGAVVRTIPNPSISISGLAYRNGEVFVRTDSNNAITVINYDTGSVSRTFTIASSSESLGAGTDYLYAKSGTTLYTLDPLTGATVSSRTLSSSTGEGLGVIGNELFNSTTSTVLVYDRTTFTLLRTLTGLTDLEAVGADGGDAGQQSNFYRVELTAGSTFQAFTTTPADGAGQFLNQFDSLLELYDSVGGLVASNDNGAADGRNALLDYTVATSGIYFVRVTASPASTSQSSRGEYLLHFSGATATASPFGVASVTPVDGAVLTVPTSQVTVTFNAPLLLSSVAASDLTIDGIAATGFTIVDDLTVTFAFADGLKTGVHQIAIAAGAMLDLQATPVAAFTSQVTVDLTGPRIVGSSIQQSDVLTPGNLAIVVTFDEAMKLSNLDASDFTLRGNFRNVNYAATSFSFDAGGTTLTLGYASLPEDSYMLTLLSGDGRFEDLEGFDLDGETPTWPIPPNISGDGTAGGNFVVTFSTDVTGSASLPTPLISDVLAGSLIYKSTPYTAYIGAAGETEDVTIVLDAGQKLTVAVAPSVGLQTELSIVDPDGVLVGSFTASAVGANLIVQDVTVAKAGNYALRIASSGATIGSATIALTLNAALEAEVPATNVNDTPATAQNIDGSLVGIGANASRLAVAALFSGGAFTAASEDFESGLPASFWSTYSSNANGRVQVTGINGVHGGSNAMYMDTSSSFTLNEAIWTVDLAALQAATLGFWHSERGDEQHVFSGSFTGHVNADGVAISADGNTWHPIWNAADQTAGVWTQYTFDLAAAAASAGITLGANFKIKFQQYDDNPLTTDGRAWDDITITTPSTDVDHYSFTLAAGDTISFALDKQIAGPSLQLALQDAAGIVLATGSAVGNLDAFVDGYDASAAGTYYAVVTGAQSTAYDLVVTKNAAFDNSANVSLASAQHMGALRTTLGHVGASSSDYYAFEVAAATTLTITTRTPADGTSQFVNTLDPSLELYDAPGNLLDANDNGAADGRNALLTYVVAPGVYRVRVAASPASGGEYVLSIAEGTGPAVRPIAAASTNEDASAVIDFAVGDPDTPLGQLAVAVVSGNSTLMPDANLALTNLGGGNWRLTAMPVADQNGSTTITVTVGDGTTTHSTSFTLAVNAVNDVPSFSKGADQTVLRTDGPQSIAGWATSLSAGANEPAQTLTFQVSNNNPSLFTVAPTVGSDGTLTYTPSGVIGTSHVTVAIKDNGGTANGGVDTSAPQTFTIQINNDTATTPSIATIADLTANEDGAGAVDFVVSHTTLPTNSLTVTTTSGNQTLLPDGGLVLTDLGGGNWRLAATPMANQSGTALVTVTVNDGAVSFATTFTITVVAVNDAPSFTKGADQKVTRLAGPQTVAGWATGISQGPNETGQSLTFQVSNDNPSLFTVAPTISSSGTLSYTPSGILGTVVVTATLKDTGGTALGGSDASAAQTFTITIDNSVSLPSGLDPTFDADGVQTITSFLGSNDVARDIARQANGKYVVVGHISTGSSAPTSGLSRYNADGTLDTTFGNGGSVIPPGALTRLHAVEVLADGKIIVAGESASNIFVACYNADGTLDATFGVAGSRTLNTGGNTSTTGHTAGLAIQADGKIVVVKYSIATNPSSFDSVIARFTASGAVDTTFNGTGFRIFSLATGTATEAAYDVVVQSDGKLVMIGITNLGTGNDFYAARFNTDGTLDTSFNGTGYTVINVGASSSSSDTAYRVSLQTDDKIVIGGVAASDFALVRLNTDGTFDTSFDGDGKVTTNINGTDQIRALAIQSDGNILAGGYTSGTGGDDFALARYTTSGALDTTFDGDGKRTLAVGTAADQIHGLLIDDDGKVVVVGTTTNASNGGDFVISRFLPDGILDGGFNGTGTNTIGFGFGSARISTTFILPDDRILVGGFLSEGVNSTGRRAIWMLNADGALDTSFGVGGVVSGTAATTGNVKALALQSDGKILFLDTTGDRLGRLNADGTDDATFGTAGTLTLSTWFSDANAMALQSDGSIVIAGYRFNSTTSSNEFSIIRLTAAATLDTSFDGDGWATVDVGSGHDQAHAITLQGDGKIVVAGYGGNGSNDDFAVIRLNTDGSLDTSFSGDGKVLEPIGTGTDQARSVLIQSDGKIVIGGQSTSDFALARYLSDGTLDTTFGDDGKVVTAVTPSTDDLLSVVQQADGKLLAVGRGTVSFTRFAVVRYLDDGTLDTTLDQGDGILLTTVGTTTNFGQAAALQSDGRLIVAGYSNRDNRFDATVLRYVVGDSISGAALSVAPIADQATDEDVAAAIEFVVSHTALPAASLVVSAKSENTSLVADADLVLTPLGDGTWRLTATPAADQSGTALITVTATDGTLSYATTFILTVNPVNDAPVIDLNVADVAGIDFSATFVEDAGPAAAIVDELNLTVADVDSATLLSATVTVTNLLDGDAEVLAVDILDTSLVANYAAGVLTLSGVAPLADYQRVLRTVVYGNSSDRPDPTARIIEFVVNDGNEDGLAAISTVAITPANDAPLIEDEIFFLYNKAAVGTVVGDVSAADPDAGPTTFSYAIVSGDTGALALDAASGRLTVADTKKLTGTSLVFTVRVTDDGVPAKSTDTTVTVHLRSVDTAPVISLADVQGAPIAVARGKATMVIDEHVPAGLTQNGALVGLISVTDADEPGAWFDVTMTDKLNAFAYDKATGQITVVDAAKLNYESQKSVALSFKVTDRSLPGMTKPLSAVLNVNVALRDLNEAPFFNGLAVLKIAENKPAAKIGGVAAVDPDVALKQKLAYALVAQTDDAGNPVDLFTLDPTNATLSLKAGVTLDYEAHRSYGVVVRATDGGDPLLFAERTATVNVLDMNEAPTITLLDVNQQPVATLTVAENTGGGTILGYLRVANPEALRNETITLKAGDTLGGALAVGPINAATGLAEIRVAPAPGAGKLNFETITGGSFRLSIVATDGGFVDEFGAKQSKKTWPAVVFAVQVTDVNEAPTSLTFTAAKLPSGTVPLPVGTIVGSVQAVDPDLAASQTLTFAFVAGAGGADNNLFTIDAVTGTVRGISPLTRKKSFSILVRVTDFGGLSFDKALTIKS